MVRAPRRPFGSRASRRFPQPRPLCALCKRELRTGVRGPRAAAGPATNGAATAAGSVPSARFRRFGARTSTAARGAAVARHMHSAHRAGRRRGITSDERPGPIELRRASSGNGDRPDRQSQSDHGCRCLRAGFRVRPQRCCTGGGTCRIGASCRPRAMNRRTAESRGGAHAPRSISRPSAAGAITLPATAPPRSDGDGSDFALPGVGDAPARHPGRGIVLCGP
jgi:hypothetical protein